MDIFLAKLRKKLKKDPTVEIVNKGGYEYNLIC